MKKKIPYILAMILMIPFFVLVVFARGSQGEGKEIMTGNMSMTVVKENGALTDTEAMPLYLNIEKDGNYNLSYSWDVEEPGFLTGITITDSEGNGVYGSTAFQVNVSSQDVFLKKGNYEVNFVFLDSEDAFREYNEKYSAITNPVELEEYIENVGFDTFAKDSQADISLSAGVHKPFRAPAWAQILSLVTGLIIIALCVAALIIDRKSGDNISDGMDSIGITFAIFSIVVTSVQLFLSFGLNLFPIEYTPGLTSLITFALVALSVDVIGFPLLYVLTKNIPSGKITGQKFGFFRFVPYIFMTAGLMVIGMIVGTIVNNLLTLPFGGSNNAAIAELLLGSSPVPRILVVGILAPIFEELIFRKLLIDRLSRYGSFIAIIVSGLFFGLFHGNFSQFFFASLIGFLFAFLYLKTGKIHLTIILHMIVNLFTSVVTTTLLQKVYETNPTMNTSQEFLMANPSAAISIVLFALALVTIAFAGLIGIIFLIIFAATGKFKLEKIDGEPSKSESVKALFTSRYTWLFVLSTIGLFIITYLPAMLGM
ncbi:MAG: CPBP family intramembrane metalloprotease [Lachnospiraceae bacterium]|nr:CPBP family intramembrane metalloprotease [Lachnospiraceae bacterium]